MITQEYLTRCLRYNPGTGIFIWNRRPHSDFSSISYSRVWNSRFPDSVAGCTVVTKGKRYNRIGIDGVRYFTHRLAWLFVYGQFPNAQIDHINGDSIDNRICNLRDATCRENSRNRKISSRNKSGVVGVTWCDQTSKWRAMIHNNGKNQCLGRFDSLDEAAMARITAEYKYGYHENHGSTR